MSEMPTVWDEVIRSVAASTAMAAAAWGAMGGATSALVIRSREDDPPLRIAVNAARHVALGALTAGGLGTGSGVIVAKWLDLPTESIPAFGAGGAAAYLVGVFGPAIIEVMLMRIHAGKLPEGKE